MKLLLKILFLLYIPSIVWAQQNQNWTLQNSENNKSNFTLAGSPIRSIDGITTISLPHPEHKATTFKVTQNRLLPIALQNKYPELKTYNLTQIGNSSITGKLTQFGQQIHADIFDGEQHYIIQNIGGDQYEVFYKNKTSPKSTFTCELATKIDQSILEPATLINGELIGSLRKTYRLALACTYEYAIAVTNTTTPTKAQVLAAMATTINRVNGIYERELGVTFEFIPNNDTLIFITNSSTTFNNNNSGLLINQVRTFIQARIGGPNYDIGHVFSTGGGGLASFQAICDNYSKAQGVTGINQPFNDPFDVDYVSHEIGHQLGADHSFNRCSNEEAASAYEPGSGSTIMGYAGLCGNQNLQQNSHDYFHANSKREIFNWIYSTPLNTCGTSVISTITIEEFNLGDTFHIPANTAFELIAPDTLQADAYNWYQWDLGNLRSSEAISARILAGPTFRSFPSRTTSNRIFPQIDSVLSNNYSYLGERIPNVTRTLKFMLELTNRDNNWGVQRTATNPRIVKTYADGPAFAISYPNQSVIHSRRDALIINWEKGNTTTAPINCSLVNLFLYSDNGSTLLDTIALLAPNTGHYSYTIPAHIPSGNNYRIKIKSVANIFFDFNDKPFTITDSATSTTQISKLDVKVYPNPAQEIIRIQLPYDGSYVYELYSIHGQRLVVNNFLGKETELNISSYPRGLYMLNIKDNYTGHSYSQKICFE